MCDKDHIKQFFYTKAFVIGLYALMNEYIQIELSKIYPKIASMRRDEWTDVPLSYNQVKYAALDARLDFEIAMKFFMLIG
jgi:ribonuclease D